MVLRSGINQRFQDPELTMPMMLWVVSSLMFTVLLTIDLRPVLLMYYLLTLVFGSYQLKKSQFNLLTFYGIALYLLTIIIFIDSYPGVISLKKELAVFVCYAAISFALAIVCSRMNDLRKHLKVKNNKLKSALEYIKTISLTDELTGLKNRRYIFNVLQEQRLLSERGQYFFTICIMDVDHFKEINDTFGHVLGDKILQGLAQKILVTLRKIDYFARFGGEEFLLVLPFTDKVQAKKTADRIRSIIENSHFDEIVPNLKVTISIGVAEYHWPEKIEVTLTRADAALYAAKRGGRNQVVVDQ